MRVLVHEIQAGSGTVGATKAPLIPVDSFRNPALYIEIKADATNTGDVFVGNIDTVSATQGYRLDAGESVQIPIENPAALGAIGSAADQSYTWVIV